MKTLFQRAGGKPLITIDDQQHAIIFDESVRSPVIEVCKKGYQAVLDALVAEPSRSFSNSEIVDLFKDVAHEDVADERAPKSGPSWNDKTRAHVIMDQLDKGIRAGLAVALDDTEKTWGADKALGRVWVRSHGGYSLNPVWAQCDEQFTQRYAKGMNPFFRIGQ